MTIEVKRVRADEWKLVRDLRLEALGDPAAPIAFLDTLDNASLRPELFWRDRASGAANGDAAAQFVAIADEEWIGSVSVIRRGLGDADPHGRAVTASRGDVVGVYVRSEHRGEGIIDALLDAAAAWAQSLGDGSLRLEVHADNERAQGAYRRSGFRTTGLQFTGSIGPEFEMERPLQPADRVPT